MTDVGVHNRRRMSPIVLVFGLLIGGIIVGFGAAAGLATSSPTAGRLPEAARNQDGSLDAAKIPDLVAVEDDQEVVVGYAKKSDLYPSSPSDAPKDPSQAATSDETRASDVISVWDETGTKLQGHLFPNGVGFLTLEEEATSGVSPDAPPAAKSTPTTTTGP